MAQFGLMLEDGTQGQFEHPCFAWVGSDNIITTSNPRKELRTKPAERRHFYFSICINKNAGTYEKDYEKYRTVVKKMRKSWVGKWGIKLAVYRKGDAAFPKSFQAWDYPHFRMEIPVERTFGDVLMVMKYTAKLLSYGCEAGVHAVKLMVEEDATFDEAQFLGVNNFTYGYHYPSPAYKTKEDVTRLIKEGIPVNNDEWNKTNRETAMDPYLKLTSQYQGASGACHPLGMGQKHGMQSKTLEDFRKEFDL